MAQITFTVTIHEDDDGSYWADVKELPGCLASGFSVDELKEALEEAIQMCLPEGIKLNGLSWGPLEDVEPKSHAKRGKSSRQRPLKRRAVVCA